MKNFIKLTVPDLGNVWINTRHIVQFFFDGHTTAIQLSVPFPSGSYFIQVSESVDQLIELIQATK